MRGQSSMSPTMEDPDLRTHHEKPSLPQRQASPSRPQGESSEAQGWGEQARKDGLRGRGGIYRQIWAHFAVVFRAGEHAEPRDHEKRIWTVCCEHQAGR